MLIMDTRVPPPTVFLLIPHGECAFLKNSSNMVRAIGLQGPDCTIVPSLQPLFPRLIMGTLSCYIMNRTFACVEYGVAEYCSDRAAQIEVSSSYRLLQRCRHSRRVRITTEDEMRTDGPSGVVASPTCQFSLFSPGCMTLGFRAAATNIRSTQRLIFPERAICPFCLAPPLLLTFPAVACIVSSTRFV